jgi:DNA-binding transcriptional ArsR family regulator
MSDEPYLLVSLEEDKAKALAQVLSNDTARKILDLLSRREHATETEVAKELSIPLSTAHYNFSLLVKTGLISNEDFTYSEKGKQVVHYSLTNKFVIIAPKNNEALKEKLKKFLPVVLISAGVTALLKYGWQPLSDLYSSSLVPPRADVMLAKSVESGIALAQAAVEPVSQAQEFSMWFLIGSIFTLLVYFVWAEVVLKRWKK